MLGLVLATLLIKAGVLDNNVLSFSLVGGAVPSREAEQRLFRVMTGTFFVIEATAVWLGIVGLRMGQFITDISSGNTGAASAAYGFDVKAYADGAKRLGNLKNVTIVSCS